MNSDVPFSTHQLLGLIGSFSMPEGPATRRSERGRTRWAMQDCGKLQDLYACRTYVCIYIYMYTFKRGSGDIVYITALYNYISIYIYIYTMIIVHGIMKYIHTFYIDMG